jgi:hypothetical protein
VTLREETSKKTMKDSLELSRQTEKTGAGISSSSGLQSGTVQVPLEKMRLKFK